MTVITEGLIHFAAGLMQKQIDQTGVRTQDLSRVKGAR